MQIDIATEKPIESLEETFERLAEEAIEKASGVECSLSEFRDGLKTMIEALQMRVRQVGDEIANQE